MQEKNISKSKLLKLQLSGSILVLVVLLVAGFFVFSPVSLEQVAQAVTGNYNKNSGEQLTIDDWNNLDNDFLDKTANDTKQGDLVMDGGNIDMANNGRITNLPDPSADTDAVNQRTMSSAIAVAMDSSSVQDTEGNALRMVCGTSPVGGWADYGSNGYAVQTIVDTSVANFSNNDVEYFVSLSGANAGATTGLDTVYNITANSFELHVLYLGWPGTSGEIYSSTITGQDANNWGWQVHWCGIGT